jgi:hypothetical protein
MRRFTKPLTTTKLFASHHQNISFLSSPAHISPTHITLQPNEPRKMPQNAMKHALPYSECGLSDAMLIVRLRGTTSGDAKTLVTYEDTRWTR